MQKHSSWDENRSETARVSRSPSSGPLKDLKEMEAVRRWSERWRRVSRPTCSLYRWTPSGAQAPPLLNWMRKVALSAGGQFFFINKYLRIKNPLRHQFPPKCVLISDEAFIWVLVIILPHEPPPRPSSLLLLARLLYGIFRSYHLVN